MKTFLLTVFMGICATSCVNAHQRSTGSGLNGSSSLLGQKAPPPFVPPSNWPLAALKLPQDAAVHPLPQRYRKTRGQPDYIRQVEVDNGPNEQYPGILVGFTSKLDWSLLSGSIDKQMLAMGFKRQILNPPRPVGDKIEASESWRNPKSALTVVLSYELSNIKASVGQDRGFMITVSGPSVQAAP